MITGQEGEDLSWAKALSSGSRFELARISRYVDGEKGSVEDLSTHHPSFHGASDRILGVAKGFHQETFSRYQFTVLVNPSSNV